MAKLSALIKTTLVILVIAGITYTLYRFLPGQPAPKLYLPTGTAVITQIQNIGKLETVSYTIEKVITYDQNADNPFAQLFGDNKKLFVAYGEVTAGFDLSKLGTNDIKIQGKQIRTASITLNMPAPQIMSVKIDPGQTQVYDVATGVYGIWNQKDLDPNITLQILSAAQDSLQSEACRENILQKASDSAKPQLTSLLTTIGFPTVIINIPAGTCS